MGEFGAMYLYKTNVTVAKNASCPSGSATAGANSEVFRVDVTADSKADAVVNNVALKIRGTADITGTGNANLYKSTDLSNALATEYAKSFTLPTGDSSHGTTWITTTQANIAGIPIGGTLHIYDASGDAYYSSKVINIEKWGGNIGTIYGKIHFSPALSITPTGSDIVYYQPLQPGAGKLFFGAQAQLTASTTAATTSIQVDSTDGFAIGDQVKIKGYSYASSSYVTSPSLVVGTTTATTLFFDSAVAVKIDLPYYTVSVTDADLGPPVVYTVNATNTVEETVSAGTTKTFVVKGDTTGATAAESIGISIDSASDFNWDDKLQRGITGRTLTFPVETTLNY
jgi:hypothetical protein